MIIKIIEEAPDPICPRVSLGGFEEKGLYCVYRFGPAGGTRADIIELVSTILEALRRAEESK